MEARVSLRLDLEIGVIRFRVKSRSGVVLPLQGTFPSPGPDQGSGCRVGRGYEHCRGAINIAMTIRYPSPVSDQHQPHRHTQVTGRSQGCSGGVSTPGDLPYGSTPSPVILTCSLPLCPASVPPTTFTNNGVSKHNVPRMCFLVVTVSLVLRIQVCVLCAYLTL